ncbi:MAG: RsfS/YbeB/iojap family protein [Bacilli bacterium]
MMNNKNSLTAKKKFKIENKGSITSKRALHMAEDLSWNYGEDVVIYDVREQSPFVSYYIVASAANDHRLGILQTSAKDTIFDNYQEVKHTEGRNDSKWILIDAGAFVLQLFTKEERERVQFDALYRNVPHKIVKAEKEPVFRRKKKPVFNK